MEGECRRLDHFSSLSCHVNLSWKMHSVGKGNRTAAKQISSANMHAFVQEIEVLMGVMGLDQILRSAPSDQDFPRAKAGTPLLHSSDLMASSNTTWNAAALTATSASLSCLHGSSNSRVE